MPAHGCLQPYSTVHSLRSSHPYRSTGRARHKATYYKLGCQKLENEIIVEDRRTSCHHACTFHIRLPVSCAKTNRTCAWFQHFTYLEMEPLTPVPIFALFKAESSWLTGVDRERDADRQGRARVLDEPCREEADNGECRPRRRMSACQCRSRGQRCRTTTRPRGRPVSPSPS